MRAYVQAVGVATTTYQDVEGAEEDGVAQNHKGHAESTHSCNPTTTAHVVIDKITFPGMYNKTWYVLLLGSLL